MSYSFTIDQYNEGVLDDCIPSNIKQHYLASLDLGNYLDRKENAYDEDDFSGFHEYLENIYPKAVLISREEPKLLFAHYVQCDYQLINGNIKKALEYNLQGQRIALSVIPKSYKGRLSRRHAGNQYFYLLANQLIHLIQMFIRRNTQVDFNTLVERVLQEQEVYDWFQQPIKQPKSLIEMIESTKLDFEKAISAFIQALTPLSGLVDNEEFVVDEILSVLYVMDDNIETAEQISDVQPDHFRKMFQKSVLAISQEKYAEALYYFRKGLLMNRHFVDCLRKPTRTESSFQYYEDLPDCSYGEMKRYLTNTTGALWWKVRNRVFAEWAYELSIVLEDRAALMREYERLQRLDDLTMPTTSLQDRVTLAQCELAVRKVRNANDELVYPWLTVMDEFED